MLRPGLFALLSVPLLALVACHDEQVNPGASAGYTGIGVTTAQPTSPNPSSSSAASTGDDGAQTGASSAGTSGGASNGGTSSTGPGDPGTCSSSTGDPGLASTSEGSTGEEPLLLDCFGCLCDVYTSFCRRVIYPVQPAVSYEPGTECPIVDVEGKESGCVLYPETCDPPSCECLPKMDGACYCKLSEQGSFNIICPLTL